MVCGHSATTAGARSQKQALRTEIILSLLGGLWGDHDGAGSEDTPTEAAAGGLLLGNDACSWVTGSPLQGFQPRWVCDETIGSHVCPDMPSLRAARTTARDRDPMPELCRHSRTLGARAIGAGHALQINHSNVIITTTTHERRALKLWYVFIVEKEE